MRRKIRTIPKIRSAISPAKRYGRIVSSCILKTLAAIAIPANRIAVAANANTRIRRSNM